MALVGPEIVIVLLIVAVFVWGPKKVPELAKALGEARRAFEDGKKGNAENRAGTNQ
jgi:TatA/E family protein of Tat protein translocase